MKPTDIYYDYKPDSTKPLALSNPITVIAETDGGLGIIEKTSFLFSAGETQVRLKLPEDVEISNIRVEADIHDSQTLVELLLTLDAINNLEYTGRVDLVLPYMPYSRQDRVCAPGESFALSAFVKSLVPHLQDRDTITTWDVHSKVAVALFTFDLYGRFYNRSAASLLVDIICERKNTIVKGSKNPSKFGKGTIVVAPDKGAVERASEVQDTLGFEGTVYATKVRNPDNGQILRTEIPEGDYTGKDILIVDDICDGGRTFIELAKVLRQHNPSRIDLYVTHGIFSKGFEVFEDLIDHFYVANVLHNNSFYEKLPDNLTYLRKAA